MARNLKVVLVEEFVDIRFLVASTRASPSVMHRLAVHVLKQTYHSHVSATKTTKMCHVVPVRFLVAKYVDEHFVVALTNVKPPVILESVEPVPDFLFLHNHVPVAKNVSLCSAPHAQTQFPPVAKFAIVYFLVVSTIVKDFVTILYVTQNVQWR